MHHPVSGASEFNGDISKWDVFKTTNMNGMFNGDISKWDVSRVANMDDMFYYARSFNGDISKWDVSRVINMNDMFYCARSFNVDISKWDTSRVVNMDNMFVCYTNIQLRRHRRATPHSISFLIRPTTHLDRLTRSPHSPRSCTPLTHPTH